LRSYALLERCYAFGLSTCPFCPLPRERLWIETEHAVAIPDEYPVSEGHTLVVPTRHVISIYELTVTEQNVIWELVSEVRQRLLTDLKPDGFNIGLNDGPAAGQTVMHAHVHVIPRWSGDVPDPRGGIRWVIADKAAYWKKK
jgi:diadenosine tetraphosphate (Ap4A) HIT family hydrolase